MNNSIHKQFICLIVLFFSATDLCQAARPVPTTYLIKKTLDSVVIIKTSRQFQDNSGETKIVENSASGFILDRSGIIVTNAHAVNGMDNCDVILKEGRHIKADVIMESRTEDLALLKIKPAAYITPIMLAPYSKPDNGTDLFTVGNSRFLKDVVIRGKASGISPNFDYKTGKVVPGYLLRISFDARAYSGDSGSPVYDKEGRVIGMLFAAVRDYSKITLAIPSDTIRQRYESIKK